MKKQTPCIQGWIRGGDWDDRAPKTYESNFIHHDFYNSENSIGDISGHFVVHSFVMTLAYQILLKSLP